MEKLTRDFYMRDAVMVAKDLLGKRLIHRLEEEELQVEITDVEAYAGVEDKACHAYGGRRTPRTEIMFGPGGYAYIYFVYGMHCLFNVVTGQPGNPCAVLVRGGRIVDGHDSIARRRFGVDYHQLKPRQVKALLDGPGKFCAGLGLTMEQNKLDLLGERLYLTGGQSPAPGTVATGKRIGIDYAEEAVHFPYRFYVKQI